MQVNYDMCTCESVRYANWGIWICATSSFTKISVLRTGCTLSGPTVRVPVKVSGMRTGGYEYVQPVRSQKFLSWELVALYLALQFVYLWKCQACELGNMNMCSATSSYTMTFWVLNWCPHIRGSFSTFWQWGQCGVTVGDSHHG